MNFLNALVLSLFFFISLISGLPPQVGALETSASTGIRQESAPRGRSTGELVSFATAGDAATLLQFRAGNHILGFQPNRVFLAGLDHAMRVDFLGTEGTMPVSTSPAPAVNGTGRAPSLATVTYRNLWEGIDLTYEAIQGRIVESTYRVASGADPSHIRLRCNAPVELQGDGSLIYRFGNGTLTESPPVAWQEVDGSRVRVKAEFRVSAGNEVAFALGQYDSRQPLIIDPTYEWHSFYGANDNDVLFGIALDGSGNVYIVGESVSTWGTPLHPHSGEIWNLFVMKLDSNGIYQWHTFFGAGGDRGSGIVVDSSGNVYITGASGESWGSPLHPHSGRPEDVVVLKLDCDGTYQWHTFYGSTDVDAGQQIALDSGSNIYVTGYSNASWGSPLNSHSGNWDMFVLKLDTDGAYQWHTFYGSRDSDYASGIAVDSRGNAYVTGPSTESWGSPLHAYSGIPDVFILKLDADGTYQWHTFYGSSGPDSGGSIALDGSGNIYVTGCSVYAWGSPLHAHSGGYDIFILKLDTNGVYQWHTFHGASDDDTGGGLAVDNNGNLYVTGRSNISWGSPLHAHSGVDDIVVLKVDSDGAYQWHTFYGAAYVGPSTGLDGGMGIAVDGGGNIYVAGNSLSSWGSPLNPHSGNWDMFVLKLAQDTPELGSLSVTIAPQEAATAGAQWRVDGGPWQNSGATVAGLGVGQHTVEFSALPGWVKPQDQTMTFVGNQGVQTSGTYTLLPSIGRIDFNGDTRGDILWRHTGGALSFWQMNGLTVQAVNTTPAVDPSWQVTALADFNGDGKCDILWRHTGGMLYTWMMHGASAIAAGSPGSVDPSWSVAGAADFGGDGRADILWRHTSGALALWEMDGIQTVKVVTIPPVDVSWQVKALADFNGDGRADILWRHTGGMLYLWLMNGSTAVGTGSPGNHGPGVDH